tara:strand:- start:57 stop:179 length:123 start_codon:yes stop_codon:yes gene_type:complete
VQERADPYARKQLHPHPPKEERDEGVIEIPVISSKGIAHL